jgi:hypothetical protein
VAGVWEATGDPFAMASSSCWGAATGWRSAPTISRIPAALPWRFVLGGRPIREPGTANEEQFLLTACKLTDQLAVIEAAMTAQPLWVTGSMGQLVPNGMLAEIRQYNMLISPTPARSRSTSTPRPTPT